MVYPLQDALQDAELDPDANPEDNIEILDGDGHGGAQAQADRPRITTRCVVDICPIGIFRITSLFFVLCQVHDKI